MATDTNATKLFSVVNPGLNAFAQQYWYIHPYTSIIVCVFGIVTNVFNIITLTRPHMRNPINCILTGIAVSDIFTMTSYVPFAVHWYLQNGIPPTPQKNSYNWILFLIYHTMVSSTTHTASIWLAVFLAILRYRCVQTTSTGQVLTPRWTFIHTCLIFLLSIVTTVPYLTKCFLDKQIVTYGPYCNRTSPIDSDIVSFRPNNTGNFLPNGSSYYSSYSTTTDNKTVDFGITTDVELCYHVCQPGLTMWLVYAVVCKLIPCFLITTFGLLLLRTLNLSRRRSEQLCSRVNRSRMTQHSRTTKMLLVVIVMFLVAELPQGIFTFMSGMIPSFRNNVYPLIGDLLDMLALINNSVNFILYCTMSQQYRHTFVQLMCPKFVSVNEKTEGNQTETIALRTNNVTNGV